MHEQGIAHYISSWNKVNKHSVVTVQGAVDHALIGKIFRLLLKPCTGVSMLSLSGHTFLFRMRVITSTPFNQAYIELYPINKLSLAKVSTLCHSRNKLVDNRWYAGNNIVTISRVIFQQRSSISFLSLFISIFIHDQEWILTNNLKKRDRSKI